METFTRRSILSLVTIIATVLATHSSIFACHAGVLYYGCCWIYRFLRYLYSDPRRISFGLLFFSVSPLSPFLAARLIGPGESPLHRMALSCRWHSVGELITPLYSRRVHTSPAPCAAIRNTSAELFVRHDSIRAFLSYLISDLTSHPRRAREMQGRIRKEKKGDSLKARYRTPPTPRGNWSFTFSFFSQRVTYFNFMC